MSNDMSTGNRLAGKVAIITGAASGIGLAAARRFVQEGVCVVVVDLDEQKVAQARGQLPRGRKRDDTNTYQYDHYRGGSPTLH